MGISRMLRGLAGGRALVLAGVVAMLVLAVPGVGLAGGARRPARPGALRTVPVARVPGGRVLSRRGRLFVPASPRSLAARPKAAHAAAVGREIPGLRTATSRTFAAGQGQLETKVYPFAVNYRTRAGQLAAISNQLVADGAGGYRNQANSFAVRLPGSLQAAPVRFASGSSWLSFSLAGARAQGRVSGSSERFAGALAGVAETYTVGNLGLRDALTLHGRSVPSSFGYLIHASAGLSPRSVAGGAIAFVDRSGKTGFVLPAAWPTRRPPRPGRGRSQAS